MLESLSAATADLSRLSIHAAALAGKEEATLVEGLDLVESLLRDAARRRCLGAGAALRHDDLSARLDRIIAS